MRFNLKKLKDGRYSIRMRSYKKEDKKRYNKEDVEYVEITIPKDEYVHFGLNVNWTLEQAKEHIKILNNKTQAEELKEKKAQYSRVKREKEETIYKNAYLPKQYVEEFTKKLEEDSYTADYNKSKTFFHWQTTLNILNQINLPPAEWDNNRRLIIRLLEGYASSTVRKILVLMNKWGLFYSRKTREPFFPLDKLQNREIGKISEKYFEKTGGKTKEAQSINLESFKVLITDKRLIQEERNWCTLALGFGLRPIEVDYITVKEPGKKLIIEKNKVKIYQTKLVNLPVDKRYKEIKITHPFQKNAYKLITNPINVYKKPSTHMIKTILGEEYGLYSFRKGYTDIMLELGETIERISADLGHTSIERTWRNYKKKISLS